MIDWIGVATNSLWIMGLAVCLAALSFADYDAHHTGRKLRQVLASSGYSLALWSGLALFCAGVALSGGRWWERGLWGVLALMAAVEVWRARRALSSGKAQPHSET